MLLKNNILINNGRYSSIGRTVDCGSMCCRFNSYYLPVPYIYIIDQYWKGCKFGKLSTLTSSPFSFFFLPHALYYHQIALIWTEGLLIDFLQKKICDLIIRKLFIFNIIFFNEREFFESIIYFVLTTFLWPLHYLNMFEVLNVIGIILFLFSSFYILSNLIFLSYLFLI